MLHPLIRIALFFCVCVSVYLLMRMIYFQWNDKFHDYIVFAVLWLLSAFVFFLLY